MYPPQYRYIATKINLNHRFSKNLFNISIKTCLYSKILIISSFRTLPENLSRVTRDGVLKRRDPRFHGDDVVGGILRITDIEQVLKTFPPSRVGMGSGDGGVSTFSRIAEIFCTLYM